MTLVQRLTSCYDRVYKISDRLGVAQHCDFTYKDRLTSLVTTVLPRPRQTAPPVSKMYGWEQSGVDVNASDIYITGVSRTFGGIMTGATCTVNGKSHTIMWIDTTQSVTYAILVRPERAR